MKPSALMIYVTDVRVAIEWYRQVFREARIVEVPSEEFCYLQVGEIALEIVPNDEKVSSGQCGTVLYWAVEELTDEIERLKLLGARLYRGPMMIENGLGMCQMKDPFGNLIGLKGRYVEE